ncbi:hypothetical protein MUK42_36886 [Musa troglodytarum]|uniref:Uncharacterized protein n=1 Tax=Musa troglodytarum TaxID=320322 RepID=A0A9E7GB57_9LILI|nr:hypothetical protein MUK42_36886 [Musa troglodytarum]
MSKQCPYDTSSGILTDQAELHSLSCEMLPWRITTIISCSSFSCRSPFVRYKHDVWRVANCITTRVPFEPVITTTYRNRSADDVVSPTRSPAQTRQNPLHGMNAMCRRRPLSDAVAPSPTNR